MCARLIPRRCEYHPAGQSAGQPVLPTAAGRSVSWLKKSCDPSASVSCSARHSRVERRLVDVTTLRGLAGDLDHDISAGRVLGWEEGIKGSLDVLVQARLPFRRTVGVVVHVCTTCDQRSVVVRPLALVGVGTVIRDARSVKEYHFRGNFSCFGLESLKTYEGST